MNDSTVRERGLSAASKTLPFRDQIVILPQSAVEEGITLIQTAHRLTLTHPVEVIAKRLISNGGFYNSSSRRITINTIGSHQVSTFIHELGHHLDFYELSAQSGQKCSTMRGSILSNLVRIMRASAAYKTILASKDITKSKRRYYCSSVELWARAYTQFVVERCKREGLADVAFNTAYPWDQSDFSPIYDEIINIFSTKGWL